jgi:hypothetical protein
MRINPAINVNYLNLVPKATGVGSENARADKDGDNGREQYSRQQEQPAQDQNPESFEQKLDAEQEEEADIEEIAENFSEDPTPQAIGLSAQTQGQGPGLKVVLKDPNGGVIRHFTGDEFLKLRESLLHETQVRGKILDQKI